MHNYNILNISYYTACKSIHPKNLGTNMAILVA